MDWRWILSSVVIMMVGLLGLAKAWGKINEMIINNNTRLNVLEARMTEAAKIIGASLTEDSHAIICKGNLAAFELKLVRELHEVRDEILEAIHGKKT
jgi:hypothetical protein